MGFRGRLAANSNQLALGFCSACQESSQVLVQSLTPDLPFAAAFDVWIRQRTIETHGMHTNARFLAKKTIRDYEVSAEALKAYFAEWPLGGIRVEDIEDYQQRRAVNAPDRAGKFRCVGKDGIVRGDGRGPHRFDSREAAAAWSATRGGQFEIVQTLWTYPASANCVRKEVALLLRILRSAKLWGEEQDGRLVKLQAVENDVGRAMSIEEQHRLLHVGGSRLEFRFVYQYCIVALQTTAGTHELRSMRLSNVMLENRVIEIPRAGAKNKYRGRTIPLVTDDAMWAMEGLLARARALGSTQPTDYLFPIQVARTYYDPKRPMSESGLKKPWDALRRASGLPALRLYDLRHTGITRMAEAGVPLPVAMSFAGHMTERMQRHYTAVCVASQRGWGEQVWGETQGAVRQAWGGTRKPVRSEMVQGYQKRQLFHI